MGEKDHSEKSSKTGGFLAAFASVAAAAFGVQSDKNRTRDFSQTSPWPYIIAGMVFTLIFIGVLATIVAVVVP